MAAVVQLHLYPQDLLFRGYNPVTWNLDPCEESLVPVSRFGRRFMLCDWIARFDFISAASRIGAYLHRSLSENLTKMYFPLLKVKKEKKGGQGT